jgi:hypothetical protein
VLSVYLQAVFELDLADEVETVATIAKAFEPLPSGVAVQWSKFLLAMNRRSMATQALRALLASFNEDGDVNFTANQYADAAEVLALQLLLPYEGIEVARQFVTGDTVMGDAAKLVRDAKMQLLVLLTRLIVFRVDVAAFAPSDPSGSLGCPGSGQGCSAADGVSTEPAQRCCGRRAADAQCVFAGCKWLHRTAAPGD